MRTSRGPSGEAEVPAIAGCVSQAESLGELLENIREAIEGCLSVDASNEGFRGT
ncbi:MAG: type II toxin-antitoxin system HicB family antitoxin [Gemmatimonadota bacterium]|nr:type II toxin-antitoxin system HicB family antitoxin [Gemmatimonadota bacterium]